MPDVQVHRGTTKQKSLSGAKKATKPLGSNVRELAKSALIGPHEAIISSLSPKYDIIAASVLSSSSIRQRVTHVVAYLLEHPPDSKPRLVLLHSRTADVQKLITVVEQCKRVLGEEGRSWWQYNQLFDQPERLAERSNVVEETLSGKKNDAPDEDDDDFEVMETRFERAVLPPKPAHVVKSMRVFVSLAPVPELKTSGATVQSSEDRTVSN